MTSLDNNYYEAQCVKDNEGIWADYKNVSKEELENRKVWKNNALITLKEANIKFDEYGKPITPIITGKKGRGLLGRFGPNHACDPIVTRFNIYKLDVEFIAIKRKDVNQWAIPGGMVDPGEKISQTLKRELMEEAISKTDKNIIDKIFNSNACVLYSGPTYSDPRTTDCAWIETYVVNYFINYNLSSKIKLTNQPDENTDVAWISCNTLDLYSDHCYFVQLAKKNTYKQMLKQIKKYILEIFVLYVLYNISLYYNYNYYNLFYVDTNNNNLS